VEQELSGFPLARILLVAEAYGVVVVIGSPSLPS
jgi:hypothetical protein